MSDESRKDAYAASGVDIDAGNEAVRSITDIVSSTRREGVVGDIGGFGGLFRLSEVIKGMVDPTLVASTDGVGTKLQLAIECGYHLSVGIDLVAMCANDILVEGAEPLFLLDYIATGKTIPGKITDIVSGIADGCKLANCALIGGEMAEHNTMQADEYDLSACCVGIKDLGDTYHSVDGSRIEVGDVLIGLASSGIHSNGFSLVRAVLEYHGIDLSASVDFDLGDRKLRRIENQMLVPTIGEVLLQPTTIYVRPVLNMLRRARLGLSGDIRGLVHITGGGLENIERILPNGYGCDISSPLSVHPEFSFIHHLAEKHSDPDISGITMSDMYRTFNMGMGFVIIAAQGSAHHVLNKLDEEAPEIEAKIIGHVTDLGLVRHAALVTRIQI